MGRLYTLICITILTTLCIPQGWGQENYQPSLHIDMKMLEHAVPPEQRGEFVLFSYSTDRPVLRVGIAFRHEDYRTIHTFTRNPNDVFILPYKPPEGVDDLYYRLVVDGTWMADPQNPRSVETRQDVELSYFELPDTEGKTRIKRVQEPGKVTFTYRSETAQRVSIAGSFNRWDPYMYRLRPVPGEEDLFYITLPLPEGTHYYYFLVDGRRRVDPSNPDRVVSSTGDTLSVIEVSG